LALLFLSVAPDDMKDANEAAFAQLSAGDY
jgi:hypothetical protein